MTSGCWDILHLEQVFKMFLETNFSTVEEVEDQSSKSSPATTSLKLTWVHRLLSKRKRS